MNCKYGVRLKTSFIKVPKCETAQIYKNLICHISDNERCRTLRLPFSERHTQSDVMTRILVEITLQREETQYIAPDCN